MPKTTIERHEGHKVQMWVPDDLYAALKTRAVQHDTSIAEELRNAASAGLDPLNGIDDLQKALNDLRQFTRLHMEPLLFIAAMDAAAGREYWKNQTLISAERAGVDDPRQAVAHGDHVVGERATHRIKRKLRDLEPAEKGESDDENDGS